MSLKETDIWDEEEISLIKELEKLSDHQLIARLVYELHNLNNNYRSANFQKIDEFLEYLAWLEKNENNNECLSYKQFLDDECLKQHKSFEEERQNRENAWLNYQELIVELTNKNEENKRELIEKIKNYCKNKRDWMSKYKKQRIEFFRQDEFKYKLFNLSQYGIKNIN